jgi:hypothetical protein
MPTLHRETRLRRRIGAIATAVALTSPLGCSALTLREFYALGTAERAWYLGGVYDSNVIEWRNDGSRSKCLEGLGLEGFTRVLATFVQSLPADPSTAERRVYDGMNVALLGALVIDKACTRG